MPCAPWHATAGRTPLPAAGSGVLVLEVVGGPEDGRYLDLRPGQRLGRYDGARRVEHPL